jgi:hypothetical protein
MRFLDCSFSETVHNKLNVARHAANLLNQTLETVRLQFRVSGGGHAPRLAERQQVFQGHERRFLLRLGLVQGHVLVLRAAARDAGGGGGHDHRLLARRQQARLALGAERRTRALLRAQFTLRTRRICISAELDLCEALKANVPFAFKIGQHFNIFV